MNLTVQQHWKILSVILLDGDGQFPYRAYCGGVLRQLLIIDSGNWPFSMTASPTRSTRLRRSATRRKHFSNKEVAMLYDNLPTAKPNLRTFKKASL